MLFGKLIQNHCDKKWFEGFVNLVNILGIQIFYETTWKWIMYFELMVICELFMFYLLGSKDLGFMYLES